MTISYEGDLKILCKHCCFILQIAAIMGQSSSTTQEPPAPVVQKEVTQEEMKTEKKQPACKACCACPETKKARDAW